MNLTPDTANPWPLVVGERILWCTLDEKIEQTRKDVASAYEGEVVPGTSAHEYYTTLLAGLEFIKAHEVAEQEIEIDLSKTFPTRKGHYWGDGVHRPSPMEVRTLIRLLIQRYGSRTNLAFALDELPVSITRWDRAGRVRYAVWMKLRQLSSQ